MTLGLIGKKLGMTRVFSEDGESRAVTVIEALPNRITQIKTLDADGYHGVQVTTGERRATRVTQPMRGHFAKAGVAAGAGVWEFRLSQPAAEIVLPGDDNADEKADEKTNEKADAAADEKTDTPADEKADDQVDAGAEESKAQDAAKPTGLAPGGELNVALFNEGELVDVTGRSIGKGFAGVIKRHHFGGGRASHGNSKAHRLAGSIGHAQDPGRVFKGKKMAGHMGDKRRVQQNLRVIRVDRARNLLLLAGAVPGCKGGYVIVRPAVKMKTPAQKS